MTAVLQQNQHGLTRLWIFHPQLARQETIPSAIQPKSSIPKKQLREPCSGLSHGQCKAQNNQKCGNQYLAWAFVAAANFAQRYDEQCRRWYVRKVAKTSKVIATKALGCKLTKAAWHVRVGQCDYDEKRMFPELANQPMKTRETFERRRQAGKGLDPEPYGFIGGGGGGKVPKRHYLNQTCRLSNTAPSEVG